MSTLPALLDCRGIMEPYAACVYVVDMDAGVKVGITVHLPGRIRDFSRASGQPEDAIRVVAVVGCKSKAQAREVERAAHWFLRETRTVGEWFHCHPIEAKNALLRAMRGPVPLEARFGRLNDWENPEWSVWAA